MRVNPGGSLESVRSCQTSKAVSEMALPFYVVFPFVRLNAQSGKGEVNLLTRSMKSGSKAIPKGF